MNYAELQVTSNFSFLQGASHPSELVMTAAALGLSAIAITDRNSLAGMVRAHEAAKKVGIRLLVGARLDLQKKIDCPIDYPSDLDLSLLCFPTDRHAYGRLTQLLTTGRRRAPKGDCWINLADVFMHDLGQIFIILPKKDLSKNFISQVKALGQRWSGRCYLASHYLYSGNDRHRLAELIDLADIANMPLVATNDVHYHVPARRPLQDVLCCIRERCTLVDAGFYLASNAERHLKSPSEIANLFADYPKAVTHTLELIRRCRFSLDELRYEYPIDLITEGYTAHEELSRLTWLGANERYKHKITPKIVDLLNHELKLISRLNYAPYFLTVYDVVRFARDQGILSQGRGSAANSAVCYCLGITAVDPTRLDLLFERFISAERDEPPDIDVDFEHERREEVIQYIYKKYGRTRAGMTATVICYRSKSAIRDVGKVLGLSLETVSALAKNIWRWDEDGSDDHKIRDMGLNPKDSTLETAITLARELTGFPRHLSQHVGGFVITRGQLSEVVPVTNAAMPGRTVIEWDKNDLDTLGILKIDLLSLGMLTCIRKSFNLIKKHYGQKLNLANLPVEDKAVYDMLCLADSIGVFQVESRAQMTMLPRLRPRNFYDLVIEVAIVRPGPIQGDMVHPYLRRRDGRERASFPSKDLEEVLGKTLGIPLFQEQAMRIAIVAAGFAPSEADQLRRAMATFRNTGTVHTFRDKMIQGMVGRGYERKFAERCFKQIEGFGEYGFPESHAASFALLVYVSAWLKYHYPAVFACALLNSQPMGFYAPAQIVRDAQEHGVEVLPVDINYSDWDCMLESNILTGHFALRLGLRQIRHFPKSAAKIILKSRSKLYTGPVDLWRRTGLSASILEKLANGDAWRSNGLDRRNALWAIKRLRQPELPLFSISQANSITRDVSRCSVTPLPIMQIGEHIVQDYDNLRLSLKGHPMRLLRQALMKQNVIETKNLLNLSPGALVAIAGIVLVRQRPSTARGMIFLTLEDELSTVNIIIRPQIFKKYRRFVLSASLLIVRGRVEREGIVVHLIAEELIDISMELKDLREGMDPELYRPQLNTNDKVSSRSNIEKRALITYPRSFR